MYVYSDDKQFSERALEITEIQQENLYYPRLRKDVKFLFWNKKFVKSSKYDLYVRLQLEPFSSKRIFNPDKTLDKWEVIYDNKYWVIICKSGKIIINDIEIKSSDRVILVAIENNKVVCKCSKGVLGLSDESFSISLEDYEAYTAETPKDYMILREGRIIDESKFRLQKRLVRNQGGIYTLDDNEVSYEDVMNLYLRMGLNNTINVTGSRYQLSIDPSELKAWEHVGDTFELLALFEFGLFDGSIDFEFTLSDDVILYQPRGLSNACYLAYKDTVLYIKIADITRLFSYVDTVAVIRTPDDVWISRSGLLYKIDGTKLVCNLYPESIDCESDLTIKQLKRKILCEVS